MKLPNYLHFKPPFKPHLDYKKSDNKHKILLPVLCFLFYMRPVLIKYEVFSTVYRSTLDLIVRISNKNTKVDLYFIQY